MLAGASLPEVRRYEGMRVAEIAEELGVDDPADVTVFDPDGIAETNSFENPRPCHLLKWQS